MSKGETFAIFAVAINTPEIGETVLPIEAENSIGKIIEVVLTPTSALIFGTNGPKAKNAAFPLPKSTETKNNTKNKQIQISKPPNTKNI